MIINVANALHVIPVDSGYGNVFMPKVDWYDYLREAKVEKLRHKRYEVDRIAVEGSFVFTLTNQSIMIFLFPTQMDAQAASFDALSGIASEPGTIKRQTQPAIQG
jgi:hypothetical protein